MTTQNTLFWSDLHFSHATLLRLGFRTGFGDTIEEHDELIVERWNSKVGKNDRGYILGDVSFANRPKTIEFLERMNGQKYIVFGNHDSTVKKIWAAQNSKPSNAIYQAYDYKEIVVDEQRLVLFHFPIESWHHVGRGSWHLHGHQHNNGDNFTEMARIDVGVDCFPDGPISFEEVREILKDRHGMPSDHHGTKGADL